MHFFNVCVHKSFPYSCDMTEVSDYFGFRTWLTHTAATQANTGAAKCAYQTPMYRFC